MRSYKIDTDRLVNQLVPHYMGGRKLILFLQSCLQPLKSIAEEWKEWADDKRIEAGMTSQIIMLEYFLNRKYKKYFADKAQRIVVSDGTVNGVPIYWEGSGSIGLDELVLYNESESKESSSKPFKWKDEKSASSEVSFIVNCPSVDTTQITKSELTAMISYWVNKYRIAGKKFIVTYK